MELIGPIILLVCLLAGYGVYQQQKERRLAERLKTMRDANLIEAEVDIAIQQSHSEAEFFKRNSGRF